MQTIKDPSKWVTAACEHMDPAHVETLADKLWRLLATSDRRQDPKMVKFWRVAAMRAGVRAEEARRRR